MGFKTRVLAALLVGLLLTACDKEQASSFSDAPVAFHPNDECHVCGMVINEFPGPKGQVVERGAVKKFCSTAEMLGWWLQPENHHDDAKLYVHDMGRSPWDSPNDMHLIDARSAFYVIGRLAVGSILIAITTPAISPS